MERPTVYIEHEPLMVMLAAAREVYNKECFGYFLGNAPTKRRPHWLITMTQVAQGVTRRTSTHIHSSEVTERRLRGFWNAIGANPIGDFHSHTAYRKADGGIVRRPHGLSEIDTQGMLKGPADLPPLPLSVLISITLHEGRRRPWRLKAHRTRLHGSDDVYTYGLSVYILAEAADGQRKPKRLVIQLPRSARKALNRAAKKF